MDRVTRAKLDSLVHMLRAHGASLGSIEAVARRLQLDPMIVQRVAEEQGVELPDSDSVPSADAGPAHDSDPNQSTQVMSLDEILGESTP